MNGIPTSMSQNKYVSTACIRDIFLHNRKRRDNLNSYIIRKNSIKTDYKEKILVYPNMVEIRSTNPLKNPKKKTPIGRKQPIKEFSKKSRRGFIKFISKIKDTFSLWQDLTFADDVMIEKSKRTEISNQTINRFRRIVLRGYPRIKILYKREWQARKSGALQGEYMPHYHMFICTSDMPEKTSPLSLVLDLAVIWVKCTKTKEVQKAENVATNNKSFRAILNQKQALKYASKYISKPTEGWTEESIGRSWGTIGEFNIAKPEIIEMTPDEMVHIKRRFRNVAPKKHHIQKALRQKETPMFLIVNQNTVKRIIAHTQKTLEEKCVEFFEEKS
jgi:hypothetical protein